MSTPLARLIRSISACLVEPDPAGAIMYWLWRVLGRLRRSPGAAARVLSELAVMAGLSMHRRGRIGRSLPAGSQGRELRIARADRRNHAVGLPNQVEGLRVVARGKAVRRL